MFLKDIQTTIQQTVVAISAVLNIEVEIADHELFRIAGTGAVKSGIWKDMRNEDFVYRECLETGQPVIVERPGFHELCKPCMHYKGCQEFGEVCSPILLEGKVLGVIGLIAFNEEQRERLFCDVEAKIDFLSKMADLIATKIKESELLEEQSFIERKLSTLIGYIHNGVIMINHDGLCEFINPAARSLLGLNTNGLLDKELVEQLVEPFIGLKQLTKLEEASGKVITVKVKDKFILLFATYHPARTDSLAKDAVIIIMDPEQMADLALKYTEENYKGFENIIGNHPMILAMKDLLRKIVNSRSPVLIRGESGTGKQFIAESIHRNSERRNGLYLSLNCLALPEAVLDKQLFGSEVKCGKLADANGGTLFLDDVADMPVPIQMKLIRVLDENSIWDHKEQEQVSIDIRIIAATDKDLEILVRKGLFRQELFYKLSVIPLEAPSLRARKQDILLLANHFLQLHCQVNRKHISTISEDVKKILQSYHWPGNIRELSNVMEYGVNFSNHTLIGREHLPEYIRNIVTVDGGGSEDYTYNLRTQEKETIQRALMAVSERGEPKDRAASWLGISRATLFRKMQQYEIN